MDAVIHTAGRISIDGDRDGSLTRVNAGGTRTVVEACLAELRRNAALRQLIGIDDECGVPRKWNISRFLEVLGHGGTEPLQTGPGLAPIGKRPALQLAAFLAEDGRRSGVHETDLKIMAQAGPRCKGG